MAARTEMRSESYPAENTAMRHMEMAAIASLPNCVARSATLGRMAARWTDAVVHVKSNTHI